MSKLKDIVEGYRNAIIPPEKLKDVIKVVTEERKKICDNCSYHSKFHKSIRPDEHCTHCGCTLYAKQACLHCKCPIDKWTNVTPRLNETK